MGKAVLLVAFVATFVVCLVATMDYIKRFRSIKDQQARFNGMEYDPKTKTYYNPNQMTRTERNGVVSFKSKDKK